MINNTIFCSFLDFGYINNTISSTLFYCLFSLALLSLFIFTVNTVYSIGFTLFHKGKLLDTAAKGSQIVMAIASSLTAYQSIGAGGNSNDNNKDKKDKDEPKSTNTKNTDTNQNNKQDAAK